MFQTEDCDLVQTVKVAFLYGKASVFMFTFSFQEEMFTKQ